MPLAAMRFAFVVARFVARIDAALFRFGFVACFARGGFLPREGCVLAEWPGELAWCAGRQAFAALWAVATASLP
jgi:hypothetical protein